ncbi:cobyrinate a,c-diamide synthase [Ferriphaselus sp. R-1]|uniref:cobyrinate a,c-diamide synthase n=1 Tax=Ferriphaselus sp. R-1 TaxID=1485544 RepID=UPI00054EB5BA|nr:cobyrinate a,c-diamide synthase [Ferriphaselus sp. R-1]
MNRMLISAAHKSSGKTTVSIGLCAALAARGLVVQSFKKGPDYIDPMWLGQAAGHPCRNLDLYLMENDDVVSTFARHASEVNLVEGNKGLYDGLALDGSNSNAALAKLLDLPVILVIDARGMTRGIAPLILGYQAFDRDINIAGVILNNLGGRRHESKLRQVIEHYTDVPVIGAIQHDERLSIIERHLGLMPSNESHVATAKIKQIGEAIAEQVDLDRLLALSQKESMAVPLQSPHLNPLPEGEEANVKSNLQTPVRIAIARDRAFGFYYADDLDALEAAGAELVPFDTLSDAHLPPVDGLYIGGGFPEACAVELEANASLRGEIAQAIAAGLPAYAECGGLMYLSRSITDAGRSYAMVGAIPGDVTMHAKPIGRGYVHLKEDETHPWPRPDMPAKQIRAHEFHYSKLDNLPQDSRFAYHVERGYGIDGDRDGLVVNNLLASYTHLRTIGSCYWATRFVGFVRRCKEHREPISTLNERAS